MPHYPFTSFLLTLRYFLCTVLLFAPSISYALFIEAKELEQQLSKPASLALNKTETADLQRFYATRNYQSVWIKPEVDSSLLETALTFIASADNEGLDSQDYHLPQLRQLQQQTKQSLPAAIELELRTTHAVMRLAKDLSRGRLSVTAADPDWHIRQPAFDAVTFLQEAIKTGRLQQSLNDLFPQKPSYQLLKQTLIRYQALINHHWNRY